MEDSEDFEDDEEEKLVSKDDSIFIDNNGNSKGRRNDIDKMETTDIRADILAAREELLENEKDGDTSFDSEISDLEQEKELEFIED